MCVWTLPLRKIPCPEKVPLPQTLAQVWWGRVNLDIVRILVLVRTCNIVEPFWHFYSVSFLRYIWFVYFLRIWPWPKFTDSSHTLDMSYISKSGHMCVKFNWKQSNFKIQFHLQICLEVSCYCNVAMDIHVGVTSTIVLQNDAYMISGLQYIRTHIADRSVKAYDLELENVIVKAM
jgi:hypothetical protein